MGLLRTGAALWRRIPFQVFPKLKNHSLRVTILEVDQLSVVTMQRRIINGIVLNAVWESREFLKH